jgi:molybdate transport system substrate-binding protein
MKQGLKIGLVIFLVNFGWVHAQSANLTVFAAASLTDALKEMAPAYQRQSGHKLTFNFGASNMLARQIEEGAPADVFFSADELKMDALDQQGLILKATRRRLLSNSLVIVVALDSSLQIRSARDLAGPQVKRVALADPKAVPAGIYSREYLQSLRLWERIESKLVPTDNVRAALAAVESGNVEAGIVYRTDAAISKKVKIAHAVPIAEGPFITYAAAVIDSSTEMEAGKNFVRYLASDAAGAAFQRAGFILLKERLSE